MNAPLHIARQFSGTVLTITPLGNGLINDTFLVTAAASRFVLQRINARVFPEPKLITENLLILNQHVKQKDVVRLQLPGILTTLTGQPFFQDENGDYWRAQCFIGHTESLETLNTIADAQQTGFALGHFHCLFSDLDPDLLHDTLPGFHITPDYLTHYRKVSGQSRASDRYCAEFIDKFGHLATVLETAKQQGLLPLRVIHGDPKLNNFLFDKHTKTIVSLIDLDTVKPGLVHYDIGDCLRSCCHRLATDTFDLEVCAAILKHYLTEAGAFFSATEYDYIYPAIQLIPFELGLRFYTDYLEGNRYFKVTGPGQNLQRAIRQFRLCESITAQEALIKALVCPVETLHCNVSTKSTHEE
ncbi:MAG: aminoglycoside phosphotransferase family protein [Methylovulum sp.]|nr:aminoglycoside phosphotransferase family protein [Methylovulum sp.]